MYVCVCTYIDTHIYMYKQDDNGKDNENMVKEM